MWTTSAHCTPMADGIRVAQPIRLQHLHQYTSRILLIIYLFVAVTLGLYSHDPAHSCKEIRDLGVSRKDGKYWIDPEKNGIPLNVYCDMTTDGGMRFMCVKLRMLLEM